MLKNSAYSLFNKALAISIKMGSNFIAGIEIIFYQLDSVEIFVSPIYSNKVRGINIAAIPTSF